MKTVSKRKISLAMGVIALFSMVAGFLEVLEARSAGGGRSFGSRPPILPCHTWLSLAPTGFRQ